MHCYLNLDKDNIVRVLFELIIKKRMILQTTKGNKKKERFVMIKLKECQEAGCEADLAMLRAYYNTIAYFDIEGGSFPKMAQQILDALEKKSVGTYIALCRLRYDTPLVEVSEAMAMLGDDGIFVTIEDEKEGLKCAVGIKEGYK